MEKQHLTTEDIARDLLLPAETFTDF